MPSLVMVDAEHSPIHNAYNLMDRRATDEVQWLSGSCWRAERIVRLTGNRIEDHPVLVNLLWERDNRPETYRRIWKALTIDGFITLKLTGKPVVSNGGGGLLRCRLDLLNECFDADMLTRIGIDARHPAAAGAAVKRSSAR